VSTGLELIPLALAAAGAAGLIGARAQRSERLAAVTATAVLTMPTRWRDEEIVIAGLRRLGTDPEQRDGVWAGSLMGVGIALTRRADGGYDAHFDAGTPVGHAQALIDTLDQAYCVELQYRLRGRILAEAPRRNMTLVEEYEEKDGTVVLTLELGGLP
jgi:hypothetical protein